MKNSTRLNDSLSYVSTSIIVLSVKTIVLSVKISASKGDNIWIEGGIVSKPERVVLFSLLSFSSSQLQKANPINSSSDIYLTISKSTHPPTNKKPHECGAIIEWGKIRTQISIDTIVRVEIFQLFPTKLSIFGHILKKQQREPITDSLCCFIDEKCRIY